LLFPRRGAGFCKPKLGGPKKDFQELIPLQSC